MKLQINGRYNWRGQSERLIYLGKNWSGNGYWHQFALVSEPEKVWCEVQDSDLPSFEETSPKLGDLPPERCITSPEEGWTEHSLYLVEVSYNSANPIHEAFLWIGFLDDDCRPGAYSHIFCGSYDVPALLSDVYWIRIVKKLHTRSK